MDLGWISGRYWITIFLWTIVLVLVAGREARGERSGGRGRGIGHGIPGIRHLAAQTAAQDCSVFRAVHRQTRDRLRVARQNLQEQIKLATERRAILENCGEKNAIDLNDARAEVLLAEVCWQEYESWLAPGIRIATDDEDREGALNDLQVLELTIDWNCPKIPPVQAVSAEAKLPSP